MYIHNSPQNNNNWNYDTGKIIFYNRIEILLLNASIRYFEMFF